MQKSQVHVITMHMQMDIIEFIINEELNYTK